MVYLILPFPHKTNTSTLKVKFSDLRFKLWGELASFLGTTTPVYPRGINLTNIEDVSQTLIKTHKVFPVYIFLITYY